MIVKEKQVEQSSSQGGILLWAGRKVEVVGVTGDYNCGKTLFLMSIDPQHTLYFDFEKSGADFAKSLHIQRVDAPSVMLQMYPQGYTPQQLFEWWLGEIKKIQPGKFTVIACDTIGDLEGGLADYVANKLYQEHGFKTPEKFQAMGGVFWASVKAFWKSVLADLASRCTTFAFSAHLKTKYKGGLATSDKTPAGKSTLTELASLYLWLERKQTEIPSATVIKARLTSVSMTDGKLTAVDILPPRMPEGTYAAICGYIQSPAGSRKLKKDEHAMERVLSDDEKLCMRAEIAANERAVAEMRDAEDAKPTLKKPTKRSSAELPATAESHEQKKTESAELPAESPEVPVGEMTTKLMAPTREESNGPPTTQQLVRVSDLKRDLGLSLEMYKSMLREFNAETAKQMTSAQVDILIHEMVQLMEKSDLDKWSHETLRK